MMTQAAITPQKNPWTWSIVMLLILVVPVQSDQQSHHAQKPDSHEDTVAPGHLRMPLISVTSLPRPHRTTKHNTIRMAMPITHHPRRGGTRPHQPR